MIKQDIYDLVAEHCNLGPVQELLRRYKQDVPKEKRSDILVSGENKEKIVGTNLRRAVASKIIPIREVYALLQEAEENGSQHIFYFKPRNKTIARECRDGELIASKLWGKDWQNKMDFPQVDLTPDGYVWADFRIGVHGKPHDWVAKLYGHETRMSFTREEAVSDTHVIRHFESKELRTVCLARWNNDDLLELRVPQSASREDQKRRLVLLWAHLERAIDQADFVPWELEPARLKMILRAPKDKELYETGDKDFVDSESNRTTISMRVQDDDSPKPTEATEAAVSAHTKSKDSSCDRLIVFWKPNSQNELKKSIRVQIGTLDNTHEAIFFAQTSSRAVDYVTNQLRHFGE